MLFHPLQWSLSLTGMFRPITLMQWCLGFNLSSCCFLFFSNLSLLFFPLLNYFLVFCFFLHCWLCLLYFYVTFSSKNIKYIYMHKLYYIKHKKHIYHITVYLQIMLYSFTYETLTIVYSISASFPLCFYNVINPTIIL